MPSTFWKGYIVSSTSNRPRDLSKLRLAHLVECKENLEIAMRKVRKLRGQYNDLMQDSSLRGVSLKYDGGSYNEDLWKYFSEAG